MRFLSALPPSYSGFVTSQNAVMNLAQQMAMLSGHDDEEAPGLTINGMVAAVMQEEASRLGNKPSQRNQALYASKSCNRQQKKPYTKPPWQKGK